MMRVRYSKITSMYIPRNNIIPDALMCVDVEEMMEVVVAAEELVVVAVDVP